AHVMEGFVGAERCFIVKTVGVDKAPEAKPATPPPTSAPVFSPEDMMRSRYGMGGNRYGGGGYGARPGGPAAGAGAGVQRRPTRFPPIDLTTNRITLERLIKPKPILLAGDHNLFNPVQWEKLPDGTIRKKRTGTEGVGALVVTSITPLNLVVSFDDVTGTNEN